MNNVTEPRPSLRLVGEDGNGFVIVARVRRALREAGASREYVERYTREATAGDYDNLIRVTLEFVDEAGEDS